MRRLLPVMILLLLPACEEIEEILEEPAPSVDTIQSGSFDRLWDAARLVLLRNFDIIREDRGHGRILARGRPAEMYVNQDEIRRYPDISYIMVEVRIDRQGPTNVLSVDAAQETPTFGPERFQSYEGRDRRYSNMPALMPASSVAQSVLREIRKETMGKE